MIEVKINDAKLQHAAEAGMDEFVKAFVDAIREAIGGELTAETMAQLNSDQITLLAWDILHEEMMDGGMVQLIHNGYGAFLWKNQMCIRDRLQTAFLLFRISWLRRSIRVPSSILIWAPISATVPAEATIMRLVS